MKRIQIIFALLAVVTVLSVISGGEQNNYYSEYDSRFLCSLKADFEIFDFSEEVDRTKPENELSSIATFTAYNTNSKIDFGNNMPASLLFPDSKKTFSGIFKTSSKKQFLKRSSSPRSPPFHS